MVKILSLAEGSKVDLEDLMSYRELPCYCFPSNFQHHWPDEKSC